MYNRRYFGVFLTNLPKDFVRLSHNIIIAIAYGFDIKARKFVYEYLIKKSNKKKIYNTYSAWGEMLFGVSQVSMSHLAPEIWETVTERKKCDRSV